MGFWAQTRRPVIAAPGDADISMSKTVFVNDAGNDANTGLKFNQPKKTISSAVTQAATMAPSTDSPVSIFVIGGGYYGVPGGVLTLPAGVQIYAPMAFIGAHFILNNGCDLDFRGHYGAIDATPLVEMANNAIATWNANRIVSSGINGALINVPIAHVGGAGAQLLINHGLVQEQSDAAYVVSGVGASLDGYVSRIEISEASIAFLIESGAVNGVTSINAGTIVAGPGVAVTTLAKLDEAQAAMRINASTIQVTNINVQAADTDLRVFASELAGIEIPGAGSFTYKSNTTITVV